MLQAAVTSGEDRKKKVEEEVTKARSRGDIGRKLTLSNY